MLTIRLANEDDARAIAAIYRPYVQSAAVSFEDEAPDAPEIRRRLLTVLSVAPWLVACNDDEVVGYSYACRHRERAAYRWSVDVAVYVRDDHHRRGIGRALYQALFALLRLQGFYTAHAGVTLPNPGSVGLHERLGFRPIGVYPAVGWKHGDWHDVGWWQLPLQDRPAIPARPLTLAEARLLPSPHLGAVLNRRVDPGTLGTFPVIVGLVPEIAASPRGRTQLGTRPTTRTKENQMAFEDFSTGAESGQQTQREGAVARGIEKQTSKIPSDMFLWTGVGAIALSLGLQLAGKKQASTFVGTWVPTVLILGLYNKLVKLAGHDRYERKLD